MIPTIHSVLCDFTDGSPLWYNTCLRYVISIVLSKLVQWLGVHRGGCELKRRRGRIWNEIILDAASTGKNIGGIGSTFKCGCCVLCGWLSIAYGNGIAIGYMASVAICIDEASGRTNRIGLALPYVEGAKAYCSRSVHCGWM